MSVLDGASHWDVDHLLPPLQLSFLPFPWLQELDCGGTSLVVGFEQGVPVPKPAVRSFSLKLLSQTWIVARLGYPG